MSTSAIAFLLYHEIALPGRELCETEPGYARYVLDAPEFEAQMLTIKEADLQGVSVTKALEFPSRALAITFDDGCETDLLVADATFTLSPKNEWDVAGGAALVESAGGFIRPLERGDLVFNQPSPRITGLVACGPALRNALLGFLAIGDLPGGSQRESIA